MLFSNVFLGVAIVTVLWGAVSSIVMVSYLAQRGEEISFIFLRLFIFRYVAQYRKITLSETGKIGPWFYSFIVSMNAALVAALVGALLKSI